MKSIRALTGALAVALFVVAVIGIIALAAGMPRGRQSPTTARGSSDVSSTPTIGHRQILGGLPASPGPDGLMPTTCATLSPAVAGVYWYDGDHGEFNGSMFNMAWTVGSNGDAYKLYAAVVARPDGTTTQQGLIGVRSIGLQSCLTFSQDVTNYNTPTQEGSIWFISVNGDVVTYETAKGNIGTFNYITDQYGPEHPDPNFKGSSVAYQNYGTPRVPFAPAVPATPTP